MARRLIWTLSAADDLVGILTWIERSGSAYAGAVCDRIERRAEDLPDQPGQGRRVPGYTCPREVREVFVHSWRLIYDVSAEAVTVLAIVHSARRLDPSDLA